MEYNDAEVVRELQTIVPNFHPNRDMLQGAGIVIAA